VSSTEGLIQANQMILARGPGDLHDARDRIARGQARAEDLLDEALQRADAPAAQAVYLRRFDAAARAQACAVDALTAAGAPLPPLAGLAVSVKDLFDVAGQPTTGGSRTLADAAPASADCSAVARLRAAGAALVGHTNLSEFAFSGVGLNPHHGTPANPATAALDATPRVPGGSTSGGAASVALGSAWAALGSDTGGSLRIPAALQGLVGFKGTQPLVPLDGTIPLSPTLDTAGAITRTVRDATLLHQLLAAVALHPLSIRPLRHWRLALPTTLLLDALEPAVGAAFDAALGVLRAAGATIEDLSLPPLAELAGLNAGGGFAAAESWAWHRHRLATHGAAYDPRVAARIRRGESMSAADLIDLQAARRDWIARVKAAVAPYDALLAPTVPCVAPPIAPLRDDDEAFFRVNALLLRNPSVVNFLDGCALSLPCHAPGGWPVGLMVFAPAFHDAPVLAVGAAIEAALAAAHGPRAG
jgi:aspartyl-tRNA(Asn)/glutamyl-tRNA(Gln) amidotransferase subunit A